MEADPQTRAEIGELIERTYRAMSTPGGDVATAFDHEDIAVAGSGQGELMQGPDQVIAVAESIAAHGLPWVPEDVKVWRRGDVAWAQVLGHVEVVEDGEPVRVPYWTTGVFTLEPDGWHWVYWGGSEPQENPRV
ncbi:nuclear transport factor 2 family protein [Knoellia koreensis]|uniref:SnoaL-like domain-containing protein n=1 Tax=Knoellia koreensis TaxID=2730921 RepID=A0A849HNG3_9MICO|nr:SnoaL-like domain-containing protein [Knoellia sp. DB2414S]